MGILIGHHPHHSAAGAGGGVTGPVSHHYPKPKRTGFSLPLAIPNNLLPTATKKASLQQVELGIFI